MQSQSSKSVKELDQAVLAWMKDLSPQGICVTDANLRIQGWNAWLHTHTGRSFDDVAGCDLLKIFPDLSTRGLDVYFQKALAGDVYILSSSLHKYLFPLPNPLRGAQFPHMLQTARIAPLSKDGKVIGTITIIEDVTSREHQSALLQKAQEELSRHAESLEEKVEERTAKLQESLSELESFSYSLAHDVRAPLRHVREYANALLEDCGGTLPPEAQNYVGSILRSIEKLDALTRDILNYSRVSGESLTLEPVDLDSLVKDVISRNPDLVETVKIRAPLERPIAARALLDQCLTNLLDNAAKFVPAGRAPAITVRTELRSDTAMPKKRQNENLENEGRPLEENGSKWVRIWVEDNGIGIPPQFHKKIFGIFERLAPDSKYRGTGIGLAIVSKAVKRMQGRLGVESAVDHGSKFWIELPAKQ